MRGHPLLQRGLAPHQQQPGQRGQAAAIGLAGRQPQGPVQRLVVQLQQHPVATILLHRLAQALAFQRVKVGQRGPRHRLGRHIHQTKRGGPAGSLVRQHGRALGGAVMLDAPAQVHPALCGYLALCLGHLDTRHSHTANLHRRYADVDRWRRAGRHHAGQTCQQAMVGVQAGGRAIVLHAQPQLATFGIGQTHHGLDQLRVGQALAVAFEFDGEGFGLRTGWIHFRPPNDRCNARGQSVPCRTLARQKAGLAGPMFQARTWGKQPGSYLHPLQRWDRRGHLFACQRRK